MNKGFTLVEMIMVMAIVAIVGVILVMIFANTLRGSSKAQILSVIKQNGQAVLGTMDNAIRNADNVVCPPDSTPTDTLVVVKNGIYTRFRFINNSIEKDNPTDFTTTTCSDLSVSPVNLTDTDPKTGVSVQSGSFFRSRQAGSKDAITVKFDLNGGVQAPEVISGQIDPVNIQTTIQLR
ncbi:hypothetical protein A3B42_02535 [Candidatus Daviesbacteria bacterium RIFCSPLOWO2_01_FULL_38_10]|uniref:Uncharacterized protein n=1 Tax=Candidatus Daviesbacteria bacterium GW2011_GWF2_38_6 TaxID=1618432 RepID=A0A0G0KRY7_9BACT|nr:MAG: hypothetical protein US99_C0027G0004 [Candidatus Daviesbacteria bacterium GW2011_GWF2_38_6]OGE27556.1 MAG: hypothetical protein A2772_00990 [Candidatus Daviesbacteria bacterium RIFCSPHIGHO2_01_FULL_38_8b]OGE27790.1 MAG: hypothetical protein A3D02_02400 [Candidatus Daviesbacteria bacterium RIFCSPHIGHO2_02_FULL_39_41]OGE38619.1 MAG: hypothetical protein A3B42_02535 [Candidatus Daviesbacteria bacterium RIFCSPLOWO2_01_FULL_38_10]OGE67327.1 MAG: hypothetical protein A3H81_03895 [Candidatus D